MRSAAYRGIRITASELGLLTRHGADIIRRSGPSRIVELGSGNGDKLAVLLNSAPRRTPLDLHLVDLSTAALAQAERLLGGLANVTVHTPCGELRGWAVVDRP